MDKVNVLVPEIRLFICNPDSSADFAFGKGIADLCRGIRDKGSLYSAAKDIHMAYSKAWGILKDTEESLGFPLAIRNGSYGSELTPEGARLLDAYDSINEAVEAVSQKLFREKFPSDTD